MAGKNAVGSLAVMISANAAQFDRTVSRVVQDTNRLHTRIKPANLDNVLQFSTPKALDRQIAAVRKQQSLSASVGSGAAMAGRVAGPAAAIGVGVAAGGAFGASVLDSIRDTAQIGNAGQAFGISAEAATGLLGMLKQIGGQTKENLEGLTQFSQHVADAYAGKGEESLRLFEGLSITAKDIVNLPLQEQFYRVHEAIRQLPQPLQMAKLSLMGGTDSMKQWLPLLTKSTAELRQMDKAAQLTGSAMGKVQAANQAIAEAAAAWERTWAKLAVTFAPTVELLAKQVPPALDKMADVFGRAEEHAVKMGLAVAQMVDDLNSLRESQVGDAIDFVVRNNPTAHNAQMVYDLMAVRGAAGDGPAVKAFKQSLLRPGDAFYYGPGDFGMDPGLRERVDARDAAATKRATDAAAKKQAEDAWRAGLRNHTGGEFVGPLTREDQAWKDHGERRKEFDQFAERQRQAQAMRGGGEFGRLQTEAALLREQLTRGLIGPGGFLDGMSQLVEHLDGVMDDHETRLPQAMLKGSQEAESLLSRTISGGGKADPAERIEKALDRLQKAQIKKEELARAFGQEFERLFPKIVEAR